MAHWKEYDEAQEHYARSSNQHVDRPEAREHHRHDASEHWGRQRCAPSLGQQRAHSNDANYATVVTPMSDEIYAKILSLVTSGLLDCSHSVRAIETELRSALNRPDLALLVGRVQDLENSVLRNIVERDQSKRRASLQDREVGDELNQLDDRIQSDRASIQETMDEIQGEIAAMIYE